MTLILGFIRILTVIQSVLLKQIWFLFKNKKKITGNLSFLDGLLFSPLTVYDIQRHHVDFSGRWECCLFPNDRKTLGICIFPQSRPVIMLPWKEIVRLLKKNSWGKKKKKGCLHHMRPHQAELFLLGWWVYYLETGAHFHRAGSFHGRVQLGQGNITWVEI